MVKPAKILKKVLSGSKNIRFDEFIALLQGFGFVLDRISASHHVFEHPKVPQAVSIQPDKNGQAKPYKVRQFLRLVEKYQLELIDKDSGAGDEN